MHHARTVFRYVATAATLAGAALPAAAVDKTYLINFSGTWHQSSHWSPSGIPTTNDRVFIDNGLDVNLTSDTAAVNDLILSNGSRVITNGFVLWVSDGGSVASTDIFAGSRVRVTPRTAGGSAFDTEGLTIHMGGLLDMAGGTALMRNSLQLSPNSTLAGDGTVSINGPGAGKLFNRGTIRAEGGTLAIRSIGGGTLNLDGSFNETSVLEAVDGASTLVIDGALDGRFSDIINIGAGNTVQFDQAWATDDSGTINFNAAGGVATLGGARLTHGGRMNVNAGTALITAVTDFDSTSDIIVAAGATLDFGSNVSNLQGNVFLNGGATPATAAVIDGFNQGIFATVIADRNSQINAPTTYFNSARVLLHHADDVLRLGHDSYIWSGATFTGNGRLVNLPGSTIHTGDTATFGVPLENQGTLDIGDALGELDVEGFTQTSTGTLDIELTNITAGNFDVLTVQGNAILAGTLDVSLLGAFTPVIGNSFPVLETVTGVVGGTFDVENVPVFNGLTLDVVYNAKSVVLTVIAATALLGDYNNSGLVEQGDLDLVLANWGDAFNTLPGMWINQRPTAGIVDQAELDVVLTNWGDTSAPGFAAEVPGAGVPEPAVLSVFGILGGLTRPRRRGA